MTIKDKLAAVVDKVTPGDNSASRTEYAGRNTNDYTTGTNQTAAYGASPVIGQRNALDRDGDGDVDAADFAKRGHRHNALDRDGDGDVDAADLTGRGHHAHHNALDRNYDGRVDAADLTGRGATGMASGMAAGGETVCVAGNVAAPVQTGEKRFSVVEDHVQEKERIERWQEHRPVEREFVTRVEHAGDRALGVTADAAGVQERALGEHTCYPVGTTTVQGVKGQGEMGDSRAL